MLSPARFLALLLFLVSALTAGAQSGPQLSIESVNGYGVGNGFRHLFRDVVIGRSATALYRIRNVGQQPVTGVALNLTGQAPLAFSISPETSSATLAPGAFEWITITFTPTQLQGYSTTLNIDRDGATSGDLLYISFEGSGCNPDIDPGVPAGSTKDMGIGRVGNSPYSYVSIYNRGQGTLTVSDIKVVGDHPEDFTAYLTAAPGTFPLKLAADGGAYFTLTFVPTASGPRRATIRIVSDDIDEEVIEFHVTGTGDVPTLQVERPLGTAVTMPLTHDFGTVGLQTPAVTQTFYIRNVGTSVMTLQGPYATVASIDGVNKDDFTITQYPAAQLYPGFTTSITVSFVGHGLGYRQARLGIYHNAPGTTSDGSDILLAGRCEQSTFNFSAPTFQAWHGDSEVLVKVRRDYHTFPSSVLLVGREGETRTSPPFTSALIQEDIASPSMGGWVDFEAGEFEKTVSLPLLAKPARANLNRHFYITLTDTEISGKIGTQKQTNVRILAADSTKPALALKTPVAGKISSLFPLFVTGTASDARGIDRVELALNGGNPIPLALSFSASGIASFNHAIQPPNGLNMITVKAFDLRGNSTVVTRNITVERRRRLTVEIVDRDMGISGSVGSPTITASPAASATTIPGAAAHQRTLAVVPGTQLKFAAVPKPGYVFDNWDMESTATWESMQGAALGSEMSLTMPDADLALTLTFARTPFDPPAGEARSLHWLLTSDGEPATASANAAGTAYLNGTLTGGGGFTGKFFIAGQTVPVTAIFFPKRNAVFTVAGKKLASLPCPGGRLEIVPVGNGADIHLPDALFTPATASGPTAAGPGRRAAYSAMKRVRAALLNSAAKGYYTVTLPPPAPGAAATPLPTGAGHATVSLTNSGVITFAGVLADGTAFTQGADLFVNDEALIFSQLPTPGATTKLGLLAGLMKFDPSPASTDVTATLNWYRPETTNPKVLLYPAGWPGGLALSARGALYSPAIAAQFALGITSQARLSWNGGGLTSGIEKTNFTVATNAVVKTLPADGSYTLTLAPTTGLFSGTFTPNWAQPASAKPAFKGVILQKGQGSATGFFLNNTRNTPADGGGHVKLGAEVSP